MKVCLNCGHPNDSGAEVCENCQSPFSVADSNLEEVTEQAAELLGKADTCCIYCGSSNPSGLKKCQSCQATLVQLDMSSEDRHVVERTEVFDKAQKNINDFRHNRMSREDFEKWVEAFGLKLNEQADGLTNLIRETGYFEANPEEVEMGMTGVFDYLEGVDLLRVYLIEGDVSLLEGALSKMWEGNLKVNESLKINREFVQDLRQSLGQEM